MPPIVQNQEMSAAATARTDLKGRQMLYRIVTHGDTDLVPGPWFVAAHRVAITGLGCSPLSPEDERDHATGRIDMGDVSRVLPAICPAVAIDCGDAVSHRQP